jgi:hypothetical protein
MWMQNHVIVAKMFEKEVNNSIKKKWKNNKQEKAKCV